MEEVDLIHAVILILYERTIHKNRVGKASRILETLFRKRKTGCRTILLTPAYLHMKLLETFIVFCICEMQAQY